MSTPLFDRCLTLTLEFEGGYVHDPQDHGGATNRGITQRTYDAWNVKQHQPNQSVQRITPAQVAAIYREEYWDAVRGDDLPGPIACACFDYAVNSGPRKAIVTLQQQLNVTPDGALGPQSMAAAHAADAQVTAQGVISRREQFLRSIAQHDPTQDRFLAGWLNRVNRLRAFVKALG